MSYKCVPQPGTAQGVDAFSDAQMPRLAFRNFGSHFTITTSHVVDVNDFANHAAMRWAELRDTGGGWTVFQEGTYSPDSDHRWLGSAAMNGNGDIALGYSVSSSSTFPSIRFTGRLASDPAGQMTFAESSIIEGAGSQTGSDRWGDYSNMVGEEVRTLVDGSYSAGSHDVQWNARNDAGVKVPSGVYVYRLEGLALSK